MKSIDFVTFSKSGKIKYHTSDHTVLNSVDEVEEYLNVNENNKGDLK